MIPEDPARLQSGAVADPDLGLVRGCQQGDRKAMEALYHRHKKRIYSLAYRMVNESHLAEDLTQEVFLRLYQKIGSFRAESAFSTWLYRLAVNVCLSQLRKIKHRPPEVPLSASGGEEQPAQPGTDLGRVQIGALKPYLERAISRLPPGYRTVFLLHDVEGLEHEEIARVLKVSVGTSKSQLHKARLELRRLLQPYVRLSAEFE